METVSSGRASSEDIALAYIERLQAKDKAGILAILADDFVLEVPNTVSGTNDPAEIRQAVGLDGAANMLDMAFVTIETIKYVDIDVNPSTDPRVVFVETLGVMQMFNGRPYNNRYVFRFDVVDGKIQRIREYLNPITGAISFEIPLQTV
jgi:ketosteroid isomerase-like protein